ncbi:hypothetical protein HYT92_01025 [Candidatus Pacearchaeota archaeon]|nr:hypothetical protein [Candidatus Pacearchaeota archaeon]
MPWPTELLAARLEAYVAEKHVSAHKLAELQKAFNPLIKSLNEARRKELALNKAVQLAADALLKLLIEKKDFSKQSLDFAREVTKVLRKLGGDVSESELRILFREEERKKL